MLRQRRAFDLTLLALIAVLTVAFAIRLAGIDWDDGRYLHPDERHIVADVVVERIELSWPPSPAWLDAEGSPIDPRPAREDGGYEGFAYGSFPVYVVDAVGTAATELTGVDWTHYERIHYIGRAISILLDTATVLLSYLIGARLFGRVAGLIAATIYAFLPIAIQSSHFFTVDAWLTCFLGAALYVGIDAVQRGTMWKYALMGMWFGLALATKATAAPFATIIALALGLAAWREYARRDDLDAIAYRMLVRASAVAITTIAVFALGEPFALIRPDAYLDSLQQQADIQSGSWDVPFTQQYVGTPRGAYQLVEAVRYFLGPVATLLGIAGALLIGWIGWVHRKPALLLIAVWIALYALLIVLPETKFPRYTLPIAPAIAVSAGFAIVALATVARRRFGRAIAVAFVSAMLVISTGWGAAFAHVTIQEHTRVAASVWMYERLPPGSTTTHEIWDDRLPVSLASGHSSDARRIDDASINHYASRPTYGDIALLAPALAQLPSGDRLDALVRAGRAEDAVSLLRSLSTTDFLASSAADSVAIRIDAYRGARETGRLPSPAAGFQLALVRASAAITTGTDLRTDIRDIAADVALDNEITPRHAHDVAGAIERAADSSMPRRLHNLLNEADYYVLASDRVQRGMEQNPWRYAVPTRFYELLDSGEAGVVAIERFRSFPTLFGLSFEDATADETFINYDHPTVTIYRADDVVPYERFVQLLGSSALAQAEPSREPDNEPLTLDEPVSDLPDVTDARWSSALTGSSWGATAVWVLLLAAMQLAAWPIARAVFRGFPDGGWGLCRLIAFILPATVFWWVSSVGLLQFRAVWVVVTLVLFALASWLWFGRMDRAPRGWNYRAVGAAEAIFWLTFLLFLLFKLLNPDSWHFYWGGEKPMEFAQINAILRSPEFPPVDPWYAQGYVNYYYYSFYLVAFLIKATGIPTEIAFNLAQPMVIGLLASATFSVGAMLGNRLSRARQSGIVSGLVATVLVMFAGNMVAVAQMVATIQRVDTDLDAFSLWVWNPSRSIIDAEVAQLITEFPYFTALYGDLHSHVVGMPLLVLCIALAATFAIDGPKLARARRRSTLARYLVAIVTLGIVYPTNAWDLPIAAGLVAGGIVIGSASLKSLGRRLAYGAGAIATIGLGSWIVALPFLLHFQALFGEISTVRETTSLLELEAHFGGLLLVATAAVPPLFALGRTGTRMVAPIWLFAVMCIVLLGRWLAVSVAPELVDALDVATVTVVAGIWLLSIQGQRRRLDLGLPWWTTQVLSLAAVLAVVGFIVVDNLVAALWLSIGFTATAVFLRRRFAALRLVALMVAGAAFTGAGVEVVFLVDDLVTTDWARMNTVFKFYNQVWILLGLAGGGAAGVTMSAFLGRLARTPRPGSPARGDAWLRPATATALTALVLTLAMAYPISATGIRLTARFEPRPDELTLNAHAWMEYGTVETLDDRTIHFDEDRDVIDWFNEEVGGTPVIAEASLDKPYRCNSSRISIGTGLPSVLGWARHQQQQRDLNRLPQRAADLRVLYASEEIEQKLAILHRYDVQYIVVGELERVYPFVYGNDCASMDQVPQYRHLDLDAGIATFEEMVGSTLEVAFQSGDTVVYRVVGNS